ncbi:hypothetical protein [Microcoleus sp. B4-D4]|uniref:hypothetical protein n=1 Tax=Microcoleus sp. B4-D4 TaxID=2818667 RepID=UPI002FD52A53
MKSQSILDWGIGGLGDWGIGGLGDWGIDTLSGDRTAICRVDGTRLSVGAPPAHLTALSLFASAKCWG